MAVFEKKTLKTPIDIAIVCLEQEPNQSFVAAWDAFVTNHELLQTDSSSAWILPISWHPASHQIFPNLRILTGIVYFESFNIDSVITKQEYAQNKDFFAKFPIGAFLRIHSLNPRQIDLVFSDIESNWKYANKAKENTDLKITSRLIN